MIVGTKCKNNQTKCQIHVGSKIVLESLDDHFDIYYGNRGNKITPIDDNSFLEKLEL